MDLGLAAQGIQEAKLAMIVVVALFALNLVAVAAVIIALALRVADRRLTRQFSLRALIVGIAAVAVFCAIVRQYPLLAFAWSFLFLFAIAFDMLRRASG